jgi:hypothetical protein
MITSDPSPGEVKPNIDSETLSQLLRAFKSHTGSLNHEGPTPPQPPRPGQNADVTGARPLHSEITPAKQLDIQPALKSNIFSPRAQTHPSHSTTNDGAKSEDMLSAVSGLPMTTLLHTEVATFVPNSHAMYQILYEMDKNMSQTKRWLDNSYGWIPQYSRLYFGLLFLVQVLRAQRDAGNLSFESITLLDTFERSFSLGHLLIPGPLVPLFKAISSSRIDSDIYGNVCPTLPDTPSMSKNGSPIPVPTSDLIKWHVPALPAIFDEICTLAHLAGGNNNINVAILRTGNSPGAYGTAFSSSPNGHTALNMPGMMHPIPMSEYSINSFYDCVNTFTFPAPFDNATLVAGITNWFQYARLSTGSTTHFDWMSKLSSTMSVYSQFFSGTTPLGDIPSSSLPTGQISATYTHDSLPTGKVSTTSTTVSNTTAHYYVKPSNFTLTAKFISHSMAVPAIEEWRAMLTQINCKHNALADTTPDLYRTGTFWSIPIVRQSVSISPMLGVPNIISRSFHRTTRDESI